MYNLDIYKNAIRWIHEHTKTGMGIICRTHMTASYPEVTGYYIPSLMKWGYRELAVAYAKWLLSIQHKDGSWYDAEGKAAYIFDSAQVIKGLMAIRDIMPEVDKHILRGCDWILGRMNKDGRLVTPTKDAWGNDPDVCDEVIHIYCLSPLIEAGNIFNRLDYIEKAEKIFQYYKDNYYEKMMSFSLLSHFYAYIVEGLVDLEKIDMAREAMKQMEKYQTVEGAVPAYNHVDWVCSTGMFQLAMIWFRLGDIEHGNKAFAYACSLQNPSGGWYGSYPTRSTGGSCTYLPNDEISWANKFFLDALYYKNIAEFNHISDSFLPTIDEKDGRYQEVLKCVQKYKDGRILEVGCGKGRYIKRLVKDVPNNEYHAVDISSRVMDAIDGSSVKKRQGSITCLPYEDNTFQLVYACESLEHAIDIDRAICEMARVVKTGGQIVVVDKNMDNLGQLRITPWEQWFDANGLLNIMKQYCTDVEVIKDVDYEGHKSDGLFYIWIGKVR